jgi:hypothetical protein
MKPIVSPFDHLNAGASQINGSSSDKFLQQVFLCCL